MGASESKPVVLPVRGPETPIKFSNEVLAHLSSSLAETTPTPEREETLDSHVRARIREEVAGLRAQEAEVQNEIARALAKENLRTEARIATQGGDGDGENGAGGAVVASSASLREDVEEVRRRVEKFQKRREELGVLGAESARAEVVTCYRDHPARPLECWREVEEFRKEVAALEQRFVDSLQ